MQIVATVAYYRNLYAQVFYVAWTYILNLCIEVLEEKKRNQHKLLSDLQRMQKHGIEFQANTNPVQSIHEICSHTVHKTKVMRPVCIFYF